MRNRIKSAFNPIRAEKCLIEDTLAFLKQDTPKKLAAPFYLKKLTAVFILLAALAVGIPYNLYFAERAYVDLEINPSIELSINHFDRVIGANAYNYDGENILKTLNIKHKNYADALGMIIDSMSLHGFINDFELISVTLRVNDGNKESIMLSNIETTILHHHDSLRIDAYAIDSATREAAHELNLSPAKYLAILRLQEVDPTTTIESCRNHTIGELEELTQSHSSNHHAETSNNSHEEQYDDNNNDHSHGHGKKH